MKRWFALSALMGCLLGAAPAKPANYDAFGIALLQRLSAQAKDKNVFISPVSIGVALSMAADGARGETRHAILHGLDLPGGNVAQANAALIAALSKNTDAKVGIANAIWFRQDLPPRPPYVHSLSIDYNAQAQALHFGDPSAAAAINAWTRQHTLGLIDRIVTQTYRSDFAYLTNALAFTANWTLPFKKNNTRLRPFTDADGHTHNVQMMAQTATFQTLDAKDYRVLRMAYGKGGYAAYIILPAGNNVGTVVRSLNAAGFDRMERAMQPERLAVSVPRFTARYDASLVPVLKALGMGVTFSGAADFSPMHLPPPRLAISDVHHAAYVRVDEKGTTAAAATSVEITITAVQFPPKSFTVDHPFVLALRDERTKTLLFLGAINQIPAE